MQELDDSALLREYVDCDSEEAFAVLVARHINKVYSVALRHTSDVHKAEEITQAVFVILAKKARDLGKDVILSGWLYHTARLTALTSIRSEIRRRNREQEAYMQSMPNENESDIWQQIAPLLDMAMADLNERDRQAVVLRFFDGKSMREVGAALGANEGTAKKRVNRATERLRRFFLTRGVITPTAVLTAIIMANSVQAAPSGLAASISATAITKGATTSASTFSLVKGTLKLMAWTKLKLALTISAVVILTTGTTVIVTQTATHDEAVKTLIEFDWVKLDQEGKLLAGEIVHMDGETVLKLESTNAAGLSALLLKILKPPVTAMNYELSGEIKYDIEGVGHLAMWNFFPPLKPGLQEPQYYSFTGADEGAQKKINGTSDWRTFALPLDRTGKTYPENFKPPIDPKVTANPPERLEASIFLPSRGVVYLRKIKLTQTGKNAAFWALR